MAKPPSRRADHLRKQREARYEAEQQRQADEVKKGKANVKRTETQVCRSLAKTIEITRSDGKPIKITVDPLRLPRVRTFTEIDAARDNDIKNKQ